MYVLRPDASLPCDKLLESVKDNINDLNSRLALATSLKQKLLNIYSEALRAYIIYVDSLSPDEPLARRFASDRGNMRVFKTMEVVEDGTFVNKTHDESRILLDKIDNEKKQILIELRSSEEMLKALIHDIEYMNNIPETIVKGKIISAKSDIHEDSFLEISDICWWDSYQDDLLGMKHTICMVMEFSTWHPAEHTKKAFIKEVVQKMFYFLYNPDTGKDGVWFADTVGKGNTSDFKVVDTNLKFMHIHDSKAAFLTNQFRWFVNHTYRTRNNPDGGKD